jgi:hypothetical protein
MWCIRIRKKALCSNNYVFDKKGWGHNMDFITGIIPLLIIVVVIILVFRYVAKRENGNKQCPKCGEPMVEDAIFCRNCGEKLDEYRNTSNGREPNYMTAGVFAIISAVLAIPLLIFSFSGTHSSEGATTKAILLVISLIFGVYVLVSFKKLLNSKFSFHIVDNLITVMILLNVIGTIIALLVGSSYQNMTNSFSFDRFRSMNSADSAKVIAAVFAILLVIAFGIIKIVFSVKLLRLRDNLSGLLKPFCYLTLVEAICYVTIFLTILGSLVSIATSVLLGLIFFNTAGRRIVPLQPQKLDDIPIYRISNIPDQIEQLAKLKDKGILTEEEFEEKKKELLSKM